MLHVEIHEKSLELMSELFPMQNHIWSNSLRLKVKDLNFKSIIYGFWINSQAQFEGTTGVATV